MMIIPYYAFFHPWVVISNSAGCTIKVWVENTTSPMLIRYKKSVIVIMLFFVVSTIVLIVLYYQFSQHSKATVINSPYPTPTPSGVNLVPQSFTNEFVTFNYPNVMSFRPTPSFGQPIVSVISLSYPDTQTWLLSIEISNIPSGNLNDNGAYKLRISEPTIYELSETNINGTQIPIMIDTTSQTFKKVAFLVNGQYQAVISLAGEDPYGNTSLDNTLQMVLASWQWHA